MAEKHFYASFSLRPVIDGGGLEERIYALGPMTISKNHQKWNFPFGCTLHWILMQILFSLAKNTQKLTVKLH